MTDKDQIEGLKLENAVEVVGKKSENEKAPDGMYSAIHEQLLSQSAQNFSEVVTHFSMTEVSIEIDEFGNRRSGDPQKKSELALVNKSTKSCI